jgi:FkbM family methyltransferase
MSPQGHHIAIEPIAYKAAWLRRKYPQVQIHNVALGDQTGVADFHWNPRRSGFSSLKGPGAGAGVSSFEVEIKRLDDLVPVDRSIGFIKVDVEGAELYVLRGAQRVLAASRPIVLFECTRSGMSHFGITAAEVFDFITKEINYHIFLLKAWLSQGPPLDLPGFERAMTYPFQAFNFVAAPGLDRAGSGT